MEKIIDKLCETFLDQESLQVAGQNPIKMRREWELYEFLYKNAPDEYKEYVNLRSERQVEELKIAYKQGFKIAMRLVLESVKE
ncbi:MAG: hypothetical protein IJY34_02640 [Clostridia bacterium]|nr:hypothetical protein [Clostridia bacterium]